MKFKISFKDIETYFKYRDHEINRGTHFEWYEIEALEYAITHSTRHSNHKKYLEDIKRSAKQYLKDQGFKL